MAHIGSVLYTVETVIGYMWVQIPLCQQITTQSIKIMKQIIRKIKWWLIKHNFFKYTFIEQPFIYINDKNCISKEPTNKVKWLEKEISVHCYYKDIHKAVWDKIKNRYPADYQEYIYLY